MLVDEDDIEQAIVMLLEIEKTVVEGAGAVGLAALLKAPRALRRPQGRAWCCAAATSSRWCSPRSSSAAWSSRAASRACGSTCATCPARSPTSPRCSASLGANIDEVQHQRAFTSLSVERVQIEVVVQTRGAAHIEAILEAMRAEGYDAERVG